MIGALVGVKHQSRAFSRWPPSPCHRRRSAQRSVFARISRVVPLCCLPAPRGSLPIPCTSCGVRGDPSPASGFSPRHGSQDRGQADAGLPRRLGAVRPEPLRLLTHRSSWPSPLKSDVVFATSCPSLDRPRHAARRFQNVGDATGTLASGTPAPAGITEKGGTAAPSIRGATSRRGRGRIEPRARRRLFRGTGDTGLRPLLWDHHFARPGPSGLFDQDRVAGADSSGSTARWFLRPRSRGEPGWLDEHRSRLVPAPALDRPPHFNEHSLDNCVHLVVALASICMARDILIRCRGCRAVASLVCPRPSISRRLGRPGWRQNAMYRGGAGPGHDIDLLRPGQVRSTLPGKEHRRLPAGPENR